eukprot:2942229-Pyramimonas_sp.AAC.1
MTSVILVGIPNPPPRSPPPHGFLQWKFRALLGESFPSSFLITIVLAFLVNLLALPSLSPGHPLHGWFGAHVGLSEVEHQTIGWAIRNLPV